MKNKLNHHGHVLTSLDELELIFKRSHQILTIKEKKELHFNGVHTFYVVFSSQSYHDAIVTHFLICLFHVNSDSGNI